MCRGYAAFVPYERTPLPDSAAPVAHHSQHAPDHKRQLRVQQAVLQADDGKAAQEGLSGLGLLQKLKCNAAEHNMSEHTARLSGM